MHNSNQTFIKVDNERIFCEYKLADKNAVIIHGGGPSTQLRRYYPVAKELDKHGIGFVLFDLSGHGESSGKLGELTLERRKQQAIGVINALIPEDEMLYLIGFSMGGHTVCDLLPIYGYRTEGVLLACPAIYRADVQDLPFGTDTFTAKLRESGSWQTSNAAQYLADFKGKTVIGIGDNDEVIPSGVVEMLKTASKDLAYIELTDAAHALMDWLPEHPEKLEKLISNLISN